MAAQLTYRKQLPKVPLYVHWIIDTAEYCMYCLHFY